MTQDKINIILEAPVKQAKLQYTYLMICDQA